jgi:hypothetical protein
MKKIVKRSNIYPTGKYPSWKMGRMIEWVSIDHLTAFKLLDANSKVSKFEECPMEIEYEKDGIVLTERPEILVVYGGVKELWNIEKIDADFQRDENQDEALAQTLAGHGYIKRIVPAKVLYLEPRITNINYLLSLGRKEINLIDREKVRVLFLNNPEGICWGDLTNIFENKNGEHVISRLVLEGVLRIDLLKLLTKKTCLFWNSEL